MNKLAFFLVVTASLFYVVGCGSSPDKTPSSPETPSVVTPQGDENDPLKRYPDGLKAQRFNDLVMFPPHLESCKKGGSEMVYPFAVMAHVGEGGSAESVPLTPGMIVGPAKNKLIPGWNFTGANLYSYATEVYQMDGSYPGASCATSGICPNGYVCAPMGLNFEGQSYFGDKQCLRPVDIPFATQPDAFKSLVTPSTTESSNAQAKKKVVTFVFDTTEGFNQAFGGGVGNYSTGDLLSTLLKDRFLRRYKSAVTRGGVPSAEFRFVFSKHGGVLDCENSKLGTSIWGRPKNDECKAITIDNIEGLFGSLDGTQEPNADFKAGLQPVSYTTNNSYNLVHRAAEGLKAEDENIVVLVTGGPNNSVGEKGLTFSKLKEELLGKNVQMVILQYDSAQNVPSDDHAFYGNSDQKLLANKSSLVTCNSQTDCYSNEECRPLYTDTGTVAGTDKYCRPKLTKVRGTNGFFGPSAEFSTLACETGGHFFYYNESKSSTSFFQALVPLLTDAVYTVKAPLPPFLKSKSGFYKLSGLFVLNFANSIASDSVSLPRRSDTTETRLPFYLPEK